RRGVSRAVPWGPTRTSTRHAGSCRRTDRARRARRSLPGRNVDIDLGSGCSAGRLARPDPNAQPAVAAHPAKSCLIWIIVLDRSQAGVQLLGTVLRGVGGFCVLLSPHPRFPRIPGMGGLGMLLLPVELVQTMHRDEPDQYGVPDLAEDTAGGTSAIRACDITACDGQKVFGFDTSDITDMSGRATDLVGSQGVLGKEVAQTALEE